eukprot:5221948-Pyramimonas_sp.AAC.2
MCRVATATAISHASPTKHLVIPSAHLGAHATRCPGQRLLVVLRDRARRCRLLLHRRRRCDVHCL